MNKYNSFITNYGIVKYNDYVNNKQTITHNQMFADALGKYLEKHKEQYQGKKYKFIEIPNTIYSEPSKVMIIDTSNRPINKTIVELNDYWNYYQNSQLYNDITEIYIDDENTTGTAELDYVDYVGGKAAFISKMNNDKKFWASTKYVNSYTAVTDNLKLTNTWGYKLQNNILGY